MRANVHRIHWLEVPDDVRRVEVEARAIAHFCPAWNRSEVIDDGRWVREAMARIARQMGVTQADLLYKIAREWLLSRATDVLR